MPSKRWSLTPTEIRLKRKRLVAAYKSGKKALEEVNLPFFLLNTTAVCAMRDGEFRPNLEEINIGIFAWDLAKVQQALGALSKDNATASNRDAKLQSTFKSNGFQVVTEAAEVLLPDGRTDVQEQPACPRMYISESWQEEQAYPVVYKFVHQESWVKFNISVLNMDFGYIWDFADGGAETHSAWRYVPFTPQSVTFEKEPAFSLPPSALEEHFGPDWWHLRIQNTYLEMISGCRNRCEILRVQPFDKDAGLVDLPPAIPDDEFKLQVNRIRASYARAWGDDGEMPPMVLDIQRIEWRPNLLFQGVGICIVEGNQSMVESKPQKALDKYSEGLYLVQKLQEVLREWMRQEVKRKEVLKRKLQEKKQLEKTRQLETGNQDKDNEEKRNGDEGEKNADEIMIQADLQKEQRLRLNLLLNASQAALALEKWDLAETHATAALEIDPENLKGLYRRGLAHSKRGRTELAKQDFYALLRATSFTSAEAINQLTKIMSKEELQKEVHERRTAWERKTKFSTLMAEELEEDPRVEIQEERYTRFFADLEQRILDKQAMINFDQWALQYEWRYDAEERSKVRSRWPAFFSHLGPAPLPVEDWEVDYLTYKEIDAIRYHRETKAILAAKAAKSASLPPAKEPKAALEEEAKKNLTDGFHYQLELDEEDEEFFKSVGSTEIKKGYNYWVMDSSSKKQ